MMKVVGIIISVIIIVGGVFLLFNRKDQSNEVSEQQQTQQPEMPIGDDKASTPKEESLPDDPNKTNESSVQAGSYKDYSPTTVVAEQKAGNKVVLFFHAQWCPECRAADTAFKANLDQIPKGVTVLKTDYDTNKDLKTKYGVTYQHTFVQIDNSGNQITKWISGDTAALIKNLK